MHRYRCSEGKLGCGRRFTRRRAPWKYARSVRCPHCGSLHVRSVDNAARAQTRRRKLRGVICRCSGYPFPHVKASMRFCDHHPLLAAGEDWTDVEWYQYQSVLETRRGCVG